MTTTTTMEGYLDKFVNVFSRWQKRYFILHGDTLIYSEEQGGNVKGKIHLRIATITQIPDDPLRIYINSGTKEIHMKAETIFEKTKWWHALKQAQDEAQTYTAENEQYVQLADMAKDLQPKIKDYLVTPHTEMMNEKLAHVWMLQAQMEEIFSLINPKIEKNTPLAENIEKLSQKAAEIKMVLTSCVNGLEQDKIKLTKLIKVITKKLDSHFSAQKIKPDDFFDLPSPDAESEESFYDAKQDPQEVFGDALQEFNKAPEERKEGEMVLSKPLPVPVQINDKPSAIEYFSKYDKVKYRLLTTNPAFENFEWMTEKTRQRLPATRSNEKLKIWSIIKEFIGKDLSKFAVPVYLNEPLSMLQKFAESFQYAELLNQADQQAESYVRMAYIAAYVLSPLGQTIGRIKKPFNPLLHETFELVDEAKGMKYISEQVSHHPPISAAHAESPHFIFWGDTQIKSQFSMRALSFTPIGYHHVILKSTKEHYAFKRPQTSVKNLIWGEMYLDSPGEITIDNYTTGDSGSVVVSERSSIDSGGFEFKGQIKDKNGVPKVKIEGRWDKFVKITNLVTGVEKIVWELQPALGDDQFNFTPFTLQLNYLTGETLQKIAPTDSRLRPDQRAWEYGNASLAADEKHRLEEKQRATRRENEKRSHHPKPVWFREEMDQYTGEKTFVYVGGYWEARESGSYDRKELPDIY